jgi:hypothetical protein
MVNTTAYGFDDSGSTDGRSTTTPPLRSFKEAKAGDWARRGTTPSVFLKAFVDMNFTDVVFVSDGQIGADEVARTQQLLKDHKFGSRPSGQHWLLTRPLH